MLHVVSPQIVRYSIITLDGRHSIIQVHSDDTFMRIAETTSMREVARVLDILNTNLIM